MSDDEILQPGRQYHIEIDQAEIAIRFMEGISCRSRPEGVTPQEALESLGAKERQMALMAAERVCAYFFDQLRKAGSVSFEQDAPPASETRQ